MKPKLRPLGQDALHALYADLRAKHGQDIPVEIQSVRLATDAEIDLWQFHQRITRENGGANGQPQNADESGRWLHPQVNG
ncbi:hypothetical protein [Novipirellula artificiosorum]|uniref:Uncharacterized protein n=1 Tax=Novipirellula artificiosorum TaxID=2528016 RepID=A0A5C6DBJ5_9BACT|nr:hypothetical protein [Novipirellula artificiosorum]TWU32289.1 hypothetical protein Poly41_57750 [Novipirellula artificiosorum]